MNVNELLRVREAYQRINATHLTPEQVNEQLAEWERVQAWLGAERKYLREVAEYKAAVEKQAADAARAELELSDVSYAAAAKGWAAVKRFVPGMDGVKEFSALPDSLRFRYAAFAAAVLDVESPKPVLSDKQLSGRPEVPSGLGASNGW